MGSKRLFTGKDQYLVLGPAQAGQKKDGPQAPDHGLVLFDPVSAQDSDASPQSSG